MPDKPVHVYLGLGSNLDDRLSNLRRAVDAIISIAGVQRDATVDIAAVYETSPIHGAPNDPPFLNTVIRMTTRLAPHELFHETTRIESTLGRIRRHRNAPRIIDIDLLLYDDLIISDTTLTLPHPRMHERRFVLEPLKDLSPDLVHPVMREPIGALADRALLAYPDQSVKLFAPREWYSQFSDSHSD